MWLLSGRETSIILEKEAADSQFTPCLYTDYMPLIEDIFSLHSY